MAEVSCDVLIVGSGTGGVAAAMAALDMGLGVVLTEETDWVGGQLTAQAVPPDEHPWIEQQGCTRRYRAFRDSVRAAYRSGFRLRHDLLSDPEFNPGGGWVSKLCHLPETGHRVLTNQLAEAASKGSLDLRLRTIVAGGAQLSGPPVGTRAEVTRHGNRIESIAIQDLESGQIDHVTARFFIDATELGDLLPLTGTAYVTGSEGRNRYGEDHAPDDEPQPGNQQGFTWVFPMGYDPGSHRTIDKPASYERWSTFRPAFWPAPLLSLNDLDPITRETRHMPLFSEDWHCWFKYREIFDPERTDGMYPHPITLVNWPQNDYFVAPIVDVDPGTLWDRLLDAKELSRCLLYWLQTECPRPEGGTGYPGFYIAPGVAGTSDGFAKTPYIREARRIVPLNPVVEQDLAAENNPDLKRAPDMPDSVGVGSYRIDLHASTGGDSYIDLATLPFQIPLGALIPVETPNLLPACKNIGTTHITNGCYRLHPVEWNIGEACGLLAAFCLGRGVEPHAVRADTGLLSEFQGLLDGQGVERGW